MTRWDWRDLACLPWLVWLVGGVFGVAGRVPLAPDDSMVMPALLIGIAAFPGFLVIWLYRRAWLIRRGWWIPLLVMIAGGISVFVIDA